MANFCANCGSRLVSDAPTCPGCGHNVRADRRPGLLARLGALFLGSARSAVRRRTTTSTAVHHSQQIHVTDDQTGEQHVYDCLDDVPPEIRQRIERMMADRKEETFGSGATSQYTFRDADGREQTYSSLDEMPPHVRELFQKHRPSD